MEKFLILVFIFFIIYSLIRNPYSPNTRAIFLITFFSNFSFLVIYILNPNILNIIFKFLNVSEIQFIVIIILFLNITFCIYIYFGIKKIKNNITKIIRHIAIYSDGKKNKKFIEKKK
tara:strand:- start:307 stop:657 length:351 start_codon:yes stop_codon:yes gene_type:complete